MTSVAEVGSFFHLQSHPLWTDSILGSVHLANVLAMGIGIILLVVWLVSTARRTVPDEFELLDLSVIATVSLLPIYHRFYDAALLVLPLCWAFSPSPPRKKRTVETICLLLMLPFLIPGGTVLQTLQASGRIPSQIIGGGK